MTLILFKSLNQTRIAFLGLALSGLSFPKTSKAQLAKGSSPEIHNRVCFGILNCYDNFFKGVARYNFLDLWINSILASRSALKYSSFSLAR